LRPRLSVVVPGHNRADLLHLCLASVVRHAPDGADVLVVDDASADRIVSDTAAKFAGVRVLRLERRGGFCVAANAGLRAAAAPVVELLNDDTEVTPGWADAALAHFDDPSVGAVAPLVLCGPPTDATPLIDSAGDRYFAGGVAGKRGRGRPLGPEFLHGTAGRRRTGRPPPTCSNASRATRSWSSGATCPPRGCCGRCRCTPPSSPARRGGAGARGTCCRSCAAGCAPWAARRASSATAATCAAASPRPTRKVGGLNHDSGAEQPSAADPANSGFSVSSHAVAFRQFAIPFARPSDFFITPVLPDCRIGLCRRVALEICSPPWGAIGASNGWGVGFPGTGTGPPGRLPVSTTGRSIREIRYKENG